MILTSQQMKAAEGAAFHGGSTPAGLREIAGEGIAGSIHQFFPGAGTLVVYCGKGNNGGDALVAARHLAEAGWRVVLRLAAPADELAPLARRNLELLQDTAIQQGVPQTSGSLVLLDGLLGIGATGAPRGVVSELIDEINLVRKERGASTVAVDLPSGLDATSGEIPGVCVQADFTVTLGAVKTGLVADTATPVV
ncbi:MAG: NAD(P)H-hydrate epimerase, partial [Verrucomicrobia bacterium]|nr:NAD(P)H-hydrate epimerase [Verrucomicrobiota bacterium]